MESLPRSMQRNAPSKVPISASRCPQVFTSEFYSIGAPFAVYGAGVLVASAYRRQQGNRQFFTEMESVGGDNGAPVGAWWEEEI
jgi:hypothetical protein